MFYNTISIHLHLKTIHFTLMNEKTLQVGAKIKKMRDLRGLTQTEMAEKLNLSLNAYGKVEREETELSLSRLQEIANILQITMHDLLDFDDKKLNFTQNHNYHDTSSSTNIAYQETKSDFENERKQYEARITDLKQENERLHALLEKSLTK